MDEPLDRYIYILKCKHFIPSSNVCVKRSGWVGNCHVTLLCNGKCERMKRYDKRQREKETPNEKRTN